MQNSFIKKVSFNEESIFLVHSRTENYTKNVLVLVHEGTVLILDKS